MSTAVDVCIRKPGSVWSLCRCTKCRAHNARLVKVRRTGRDVGISNTAAWDALDALVAAGVTSSQIAEATGLTRTTVSAMMARVREGRRTPLRHVTRAALIALAQKPPTPSWVDSCGPARRLQALTARGWTMPQVSALCGVPTSTLSDLRCQTQNRTRADLADTIREVYDRIWDKAPTGDAKAISRSLRLAQENGWAVPLDWDDEAIDNPDASPWKASDFWGTCGQCDGTGRERNRPTRTCPACKGFGARESRRSRSNAIDVEEVALLASAGSNWEDLSARLGVERDSLYARLQRDGHRRLLRTISRNSVLRAEDVDAVLAYNPKAAS